MFHVDGSRSFRCAYHLDRGSKRGHRLYDTVNAQMPRPTTARCVSGARDSFGERLLDVIGDDLDTKRRADSTLPVPADVAGGRRVR